MRILLALLLVGAAPCAAGVLESGSYGPTYLPSGGAGSEIWELDANSDWQPTVAGTSDVFWELDSLGQIIPKGGGYEMDTNGDLQPLN